MRFRYSGKSVTFFPVECSIKEENDWLTQTTNYCFNKRYLTIKKHVWTSQQIMQQPMIVMVQ
jgi:hypothetical protein